MVWQVRSHGESVVTIKIPQYKDVGQLGTGDYYYDEIKTASIIWVVFKDSDNYNENLPLLDGYAQTLKGNVAVVDRQTKLIRISALTGSFKFVGIFWL